MVIYSKSLGPAQLYVSITIGHYVYNCQSRA